MAKKRLLIALMAIPISLASLLVVGAQKPHLANAGGVIDPTCTNSLPCIEYDNKGSGPGVKSTSAKGGGLVGVTTFNSTSSVNGTFGIFGNDLSTSGSFDSGVRGTSIRGTGVSGTSSSGAGVIGKSTSGIGIEGLAGNSNASDGVFGSSTNGAGVIGASTNGIGVNGHSSTAAGVNGLSTSGTGVNASSISGDGVSGFSSKMFGVVGSTGGASASIAGVEGINNLSTTAVRAKGFGGPLFVGNNSSGHDVFTVDDSGDMTVSGLGVAKLGLIGSSNEVGVSGDNGDTTGSGGLAGVEGTNNTASTAVRANGFGGPLFVGNNSGGHNAFVVDDSGNVTITGLLKTGGSCSIGCARTNASPGARIVSYSPREAEPTLEDVGEAQLVGGQAYVRLDPAFGNAIDQYHNYLVFITPEGDSRGLYVTGKTLTGFTVRESQGGHSTLAFSYRIVAKPFGISEPRLPRMLLVAHPKHQARLNHTPTLR